MTTEVIARRGAVDPQALDEQARRAVSVFRDLQPTFTSYARNLTGRKNVRVECAAQDNGSTDGTVIYYRPPLALGDNTQHVRSLCDKRGDNGLQLCRACAIREEIIVTILHEIAHICFDSFARTTDDDKRRAISFAVKEAKGKWAEQIAERINNAPSWKTRDYINLVSLINEYLPFLLNCLEDARVNRELFKARTGMKKMFAADTQHVFEEGFESRMSDGSVKMVRWQEAPLNSQAMIGVFCKASGYDYSQWFHPRVIEALDDPRMTDLIRTMDTIRSAAGVYNLSFKVLALLRDLGFCGTPQDPDPEPEPEEKNDEQDQPSEGSSEADDQAGEPSEGLPSDPGEQASGEGDPEDAQEEREGSSKDDLRDDSGSTDDERSDDVEEGSGASGTPEEESSVSDDAGDSSDDDDGPEQAGNDGGVDESDDSTGDPGTDSSGDNSAGSDGTSREAERDAEVSPDSKGVPDQGDQPKEGEVDDSQADSHDAEGQDGPDGPAAAGSPQQSDISEQDDSVRESHGDSGTEGSGDQLPRDAGKDAEDSSAVGSDPESSGKSDNNSSEPIDTGADDGYGGTKVDQEPEPPMGTPDEVDPIIKKWGAHEEKPKSLPSVQQAEDEAISKAIIQGIYFTTPSQYIRGVREHFYGKPSIEDGIIYSKAWVPGRDNTDPVIIPDAIIAPALLRARRTFTDNQRAKQSYNRKSGKVNARVLGRRAWNNDPRLFGKKTLPGKKDYFVVIGMDISGSTIGLNLALEKRAIASQADMLDRLGIPFAIYAHTGGPHTLRVSSAGRDVEVYHLKDANEPWIDSTRKRLEKIGSSGTNLDGHALEFLRKVADKSTATNKIILYYTDGKMPASNVEEETEVLVSEIRVCDRKGYLLLGVGIRTDSPRRHGLDTVQVDRDEDLVKVVEHLEKGLRAME